MEQPETKVYFLTVECYAPMSGIVPVEAASPEEAEAKLRSELTTAKDIVVLNIEEAPPMPTEHAEQTLN